MNAIFRTCAALLGLLTLGTVSDGYTWVTPVFKQPYPVAPSPSNSGFYLMDGYGRLTGPHYYLTPPCQPFNGILPGQTGQAIMQGYLPHTLLMSKEGLALGKVPLLGEKRGAEPAPTPYGVAGTGMPQFGFGSGQGPNAGNMQMPYANMSRSPYPMQPPYAQPMPQPMAYGGMPYGAMPYGGQTPMPGRPIAYMPYYGPPGAYAMARQDPKTRIWLVQNVVPGQGAAPFRPIPGFNPSMPTYPAPPMRPMMPGMQPMTPGMETGQNNGFQGFGQMQPFNQFNPLQGPQMPPMESNGPPPQRPGMAYPTHPFTRSPRDFFMWGENMEEERARGNRPFPTP